MNKLTIALSIFGVLLLATAPAYLPKMMSCNGADLQKVNAMMPAMADGQNKTTMVKEMAATNSAMSKGDMKGCAMHLNMAAKAGMSK